MQKLKTEAKRRVMFSTTVFSGNAQVQSVLTGWKEMSLSREEGGVGGCLATITTIGKV